MPRKTIVAWPPETHENYRLIIYKIERVTVSLLSLLNEADEHNYELYKDEVFMFNIRRRLNEANAAAIEITYFEPTGRGKPPMWVTLTKKVIESTDKMLLALDSIERDVPGHLFNTVITTTKVMLDACLDLLDGFKRVPLESTTDTDKGSDNNTSYLTYLYSTIEK